MRLAKFDTPQEVAKTADLVGIYLFRDGRKWVMVGKTTLERFDDWRQAAEFLREKIKRRERTT